MPKKKYTLKEVKNDIRSFFTDESHRLFKYGTPTPDCDKDCPFHKRALQVLFEEDYPHDMTLKHDTKSGTSFSFRGFLEAENLAY